MKDFIDLFFLFLFICLMILCVLLFFTNGNKQIEIKILSNDLEKLEQIIENKIDIVECEKEIEYQTKIVNKELEPLSFTEFDYYMNIVHTCEIYELCELNNYFKELTKIRDDFVYEFVETPNAQPYIQLKIDNSIDKIIKKLKDNNCIN